MPFLHPDKKHLSATAVQSQSLGHTPSRPPRAWPCPQKNGRAPTRRGTDFAYSSLARCQVASRGPRPRSSPSAWVGTRPPSRVAAPVVDSAPQAHVENSGLRSLSGRGSGGHGGGCQGWGNSSCVASAASALALGGTAAKAAPRSQATFPPQGRRELCSCSFGSCPKPAL